MNNQIARLPQFTISVSAQFGIITGAIAGSFYALSAYRIFSRHEKMRWVFWVNGLLVLSIFSQWKLLSYIWYLSLVKNML